jgi:membrane fusion protein, multidrug efflux system
MFKTRSLLAACKIGLSAGLALVLASCANAPVTPQTKGGQNRGPQTVPVAVAKAERRDLPVYLNGLGSVEAFNTVQVKSRLDGQLVQLAFREGQNVKKGDLLAVIDPRPYEVQLSQAEANLFKDQSALKDAKLNLTRFEELFKAGVIPKQQFDTQGSLVGQLEGAVRADQAQIDNVKLNLVYTRITAPVGGRIGLRLVDVGNMVHASDPNGLLVVTQLQPIAAVFALPEDNLQSVSQHMHQGKLTVDAYSRDDQTKLASGYLLTIDNQIDPATGTGKLKAIFENHDSSLWPNQFVNVHLLLEIQKNIIAIPAAAIQRGPQGTYVFVVKADKTVDMRVVSIGLTSGTLAAVTTGVAEGELVVTDGQDKLQAGSKVEFRGGAPGSAPNGGAPAGTQPAGGQGGHKGGGNRTGTPQK